MDVQTRCSGFLENFSRIYDAYVAWSLNPDIEKISWTDPDGSRQIWCPFKKGSFTPEVEAHLCSISYNYRDTYDDSIWWYKQPDFGVIQEVTTNAGFYARFC
jgi:hypothetical protein